MRTKNQKEKGNGGRLGAGDHQNTTEAAVAVAIRRMTEVAIRRTQINLVITVPRPAAKHPVILHFTIPIFAPLPHVPAKGKGSVRACVQKQDDTSPVPAFSRYPHPDSSVVPLVPKVSAALWERTREAKLRFGGRRVRMGTAFDLPRALDGRRSLGGTSVPQALRCLWEREGGTWEREVVRLERELRAGT